MPKYIAIGGWVRNEKSHHVSAQEVMRLYGVSNSVCDLATDLASIRAGVPKGTIILAPDPTGEYVLPTEPESVVG